MSISLGNSAPIVSINCSALAATGTSNSTAQDGVGMLICVAQDGQLFCLDTETLEVAWTATSSSLYQDITNVAAKGLRVDFVSFSVASDVVSYFYEGDHRTFSSLSQPISQDFNPDIIFLVMSAADQDPKLRYLVMLAVEPSNGSCGSSKRRVVQVHTSPLPMRDDIDGGTALLYQLHVQSAKLYELCNETLDIFDLTSTVARRQHSLHLPNTHSFLQLSANSIISSTPKSIDIYNPAFQSLQASISAEIDDKDGTYPGATDLVELHLITYFRQLNLVIALANNSLLAAQLEAPSRNGKRSVDGLLIDSIGRRLPGGTYASKRKRGDGTASTTIFSNLITGTLVGTDLQQSYMTMMEQADNFLAQKDLVSFEKVLAQKFSVKIEEYGPITNGIPPEAGDINALEETPEWRWLQNPKNYPEVDRRWVLYAISRAFSVDFSGTGMSATSLQYALPSSNVLVYLVSAGHLTIRNLKAAFREELEDSSDVSIAQSLIDQLIAIDPTMELLLTYAYATKAGEIELLLVIRMIMLSLGLIHGSTAHTNKIIMATDTISSESEASREDLMELDDLEQTLQITEFHLGDESSIRTRCLTICLSRLGKRSSIPTVQAIRTTFKPAEVASLINLLRTELVRGDWTSRYLDTFDLGEDEFTGSSPDSAISLVTDLLSRCIDSVGSGGWLLNDTSNSNIDGNELMAALRLEVSAALEGLEAAMYLDHVIGEVVRFGAASQKSRTPRQTVNLDKPIPIEVEGRHIRELPLGLRARQFITRHKVVSGGEVVRRTQREYGHLKSRLVDPYSLHRIAI
jgi:hypothetical protein